MATPPDTNASSRAHWKGKGPATTVDEELQDYPLDRLQAEIDRRNPLSLPTTPVQAPIPEDFLHGIPGVNDFEVAFSLQQQLDDEKEKKEKQMRPNVFAQLPVPHFNPLGMFSSPLSGWFSSRVPEFDTRPKLVGLHEPKQAHPKNPEIAANAVAESDDETDDEKHPKHSKTAANTLVDSNDETGDAKHPKHPDTAANAVAGSSKPNHPDTAANAVVGSSKPNHPDTAAIAVVGSSKPNHPDTAANAVAGSSKPNHPDTAANAVVGSDTLPHASTEVNYETAQAQWMSDITAEGELFRYTKETKQWKDVDVEPAYSQEVQRDSRLRRFYNDIAPGPKIEEVAPSGLAIDNEGFEDIPQELKQAFKNKFYNNLSYIQAHCISALTGKASDKLRKATGSGFKADQDALVISNTGSGKTEALLLTLITAILEKRVFDENRRLTDRQRPSDVATPTALIVVPTRTLAEQIFETLIDIIRYTGLRAAAVYGGTDLELDVAQLGRGCDVIVATPGRLIHLLEDTSILEGLSILSLCNTRWFIMDEADAMLAPSFDLQLSSIQKYLPQQHNVWLFTMALREDRVKGALDMLDKDHVVINEETLASPQPRGLPTKAVPKYLSVRQEIIPITCDEDKIKYLFSYFQDETVELTKVMIVARDAKTVDLLHMSLGRDLGLKCSPLSQEYSQREREIARMEFIRGVTIVLLTSIQLSKGLNLAGLETIFLHDMPWQFEEYLAAVGRVGRIGNTGTAKVFFNVERDVAMACPLVNHLRDNGQIIPEWLQEISDREAY